MAIARSIDYGQSFSAPERIHADNWAINGCPHSGPSLAVDPTGDLHAGWYTGEETKAGLYYTTFNDRAEGAAPDTLVENVGVSQVQLAATQDGILTAWEEQTSHSIKMQYVGESGEGIAFAGALNKASAPAVAAGAERWMLVGQTSEDILIVEGALAARTLEVQ